MTTPTPQQKLHYLRTVLAGPSDAQGLAPLIETHMSWVVLGADIVFKLKKPVHYPFLDFSTPAARALDAREELRLNRRLAPQVYLDVLALQWVGGEFSLVPSSAASDAGTVDWLVMMQRLPSENMLDHVLPRRPLTAGERIGLAGVLTGFYRHAAVPGVPAQEHVARVRRELALHRAVLARPEFALGDAIPLIDQTSMLLDTLHGPLCERVRRGRIVEGHGDLRPEHVCLLDPPVVIDALEFNAAMRQVDPFDELAFLSLECAMLGNPTLGPWLIDRCMAGLDDDVPPALLAFYTAQRALLRARLNAAHLLEAQVRTPERWLPQARRYLDHARAALACVALTGAASPREPTRAGLQDRHSV